MKKGTIQFLKLKGTKDWKDTTITEFDIQVGEDIGVISYFGNQPVDKVGDTIEYEVTTDQYGTKIRKPKATGSGGNYQKGGKGFDVKTMIMAYAKDIAVARIYNGGMDNVDIKSVIKDYLKLVDAYENPATFSANKKPFKVPTGDAPFPIEVEAPSDLGKLEAEASIEDTF